jgi:thymidylate synthase (FAD)
MTEITLLDDVTVDLVDSMGSDKSIIRAAQVSVVGENNPENFERDSGLINYLMREHHGSPFEHTAMTFYVKAPIFVFREFQRHRVGFSYNEMSGRYTKLVPEFYLPKADRPLINIGKSSKPEFAPGTDEQTEGVREAFPLLYQRAWDTYEAALNDGIANEVARTVLPVGVYSQMYVTCNIRSLLNFLTLRTKDKENAAWKSRPQHEISLVADKMESIAELLYPITMQRYNEHGRVAP